MEIECLSCHATLRVDERYVGRQARCPHCGHIQTVAADAQEWPATLAEASDFNGADAPRKDPPNRGTYSTSFPARQDDLVVRPKSGRAVLLLGLSVLGLGCSCPIFSLAAWVMSANDLRAMRSGELDVSRQDVTRVAYGLGMVGSALWITIAVVASLVLLVQAGR